MKLIAVFFFVLYAEVCFGQDQQLVFDDAGAWKNYSAADIKKIPNVVIKSIETNICYSSASGAIWEKIEPIKKGSILTNVYKSTDECKADGGLRDPNEKSDDSLSIEKAASTEKIDQEQYAGLNWGAGLMFANYSKELVLDATIDNGIIRINQKNKNRAIAMIESHYFFTPGPKKRFGIGPFIGLGLAGDNGLSPLSLYGGGVMMGFRKLNSANSWNVGFGCFVDSEAKLLRGDLVDGAATGETDSAKLFKKEDVSGVMIMFSASF